MKKYSTGIIALDSSLNGGIPSGSLVLIVEKPGAGAEILTFHFAVEGLKNGEKILYVITDETVDNLLEHMKIYHSNISLDKDRFNIISFVSKTIGESKIYTYDPLRGLKIVLSKNRFDRIVINDINKIVRNYSEDEAIAFIEEISRKVKEDDAVAMIVLAEGASSSKLENTLKSIADGIFELDIREKENEIQRVLKIIKLRRCMIPRNIFRYDITEKGIKLESIMRVI